MINLFFPPIADGEPERKINARGSLSVIPEGSLSLSISLSRSRKWCERCGFRKTYYVFEYGKISAYSKQYCRSTLKDHGYFHRICAFCMDDLERSVFRFWY